MIVIKVRVVEGLAAGNWRVRVAAANGRGLRRRVRIALGRFGGRAQPDAAEAELLFAVREDGEVLDAVARKQRRGDAVALVRLDALAPDVRPVRREGVGLGEPRIRLGGDLRAYEVEHAVRDIRAACDTKRKVVLGRKRVGVALRVFVPAIKRLGLIAASDRGDHFRQAVILTPDTEAVLAGHLLPVTGDAVDRKRRLVGGGLSVGVIVRAAPDAIHTQHNLRATPDVPLEIGLLLLAPLAARHLNHQSRHHTAKSDTERGRLRYPCGTI